MYNLILLYLEYIFKSLSNKRQTMANCIIFFTGGSNLITPKLYSSFINKLSLYNDVYYLGPNIKLDNLNIIIKDLNNKYNTINYLGHSSGCTTLLNNYKNIDNNINNYIDNIILLDPVTTPNLKKNIDLNNITNLLILNAEMSYKWSKIPPFLPFIPLFKLNPYRLNIDIDKIQYLEILDYGHTDIINNPYCNLMHYSRISRGYNKNGYKIADRKKYITYYHYYLISLIHKYIDIDH